MEPPNSIELVKAQSAYKRILALATEAIEQRCRAKSDKLLTARVKLLLRAAA
jgi:hypothetical protein